MLENSDIPTVTANKFSVLAGANEMTDLDQTCEPVANKITPIMFRYKDNYNLIMQQLETDFPKFTNKRTGEYMKINLTTEEEHREITSCLKLKKEQFSLYF
ncbi:hypothetical protein TNCV_1862111 [Trichonephila clavipes]|nr:hypothetical protein TNCV_1862111 [Trichonephila clavipes]